MAIMDSVDWAIIEQMGSDSRQSIRELADQVYVSASTTRRRIKRLSELGILSLQPAVDYDRIGLKVAALFGLDVAHSKLQETLNSLADLPEILWTSTTTGRFNVIAFGRFASNEGLDKFLRTVFPSIDGVNHCETFLCLQITRLGSAHLSSIRGADICEHELSNVK